LTTASTINEQYTRLQDKISEYTKQVWIPSIQTVNDIDRYLNLNATELKLLSIDECAEAAYLLSQRAFYIQREYNTQKARHSWLDQKLRKAIAESDGQFKKYMNFEEKRSMITLPTNNEAYHRLEQLRLETVIKMNELDMLSVKIENFAKFFTELFRSKRYVKVE
jgi:hypothetical protein